MRGFWEKAGTHCSRAVGLRVLGRGAAGAADSETSPKAEGRQRGPILDPQPPADQPRPTSTAAPSRSRPTLPTSRTPPRDPPCHACRPPDARRRLGRARLGWPVPGPAIVQLGHTARPAGQPAYDHLGSSGKYSWMLNGERLCGGMVGRVTVDSCCPTFPPPRSPPALSPTDHYPRLTGRGQGNSGRPPTST